MFLTQTVRADGNGRFATVLRLPDDLPHGGFTIEAARQGKNGPTVFAQFAKAYADDT
jgi:hypothetical protein